MKEDLEVAERVLKVIDGLMERVISKDQQGEVKNDSEDPPDLGKHHQPCHMHAHNDYHNQPINALEIVIWIFASFDIINLEIKNDLIKYNAELLTMLIFLLQIFS